MLTLFAQNFSLVNAFTDYNLPSYYAITAMKLAHLQAGVWLFLAIPCLLFLLGWLRIILAIPLAIGLIWILWNILRNLLRQSLPAKGLKASDAGITAGLIFVVIFISGISGHFFQNWDFHGRNAVFHDLINYSWPVVYDPIQPTKDTVILSYYVNYWLPAAIVGKLLGWTTANIALFLWTIFGVFLIVALLSIRLRTSMFNTTVLFFAFSGMDILGVGINRLLDRTLYPGLWPPVQHLEWWAMPVEASAILTQLYWVFNQSVPALLAMSLWLTGVKKEHTILLWALAFSFSPLPAIGLMIFLGVGLLLKDSSLPAQASYLHHLRDSLSPANLLGILMFLISFAYFSTNLVAQKRVLQIWEPHLHILFFLVEGGILWLALLGRKTHDPFWLIAGLTLFMVVFIRIGNNQDFIMRATIPAILYLMVGIGDELFHSRKGWIRNLIIICLAIGLFTPMYEVNRSIVRSLNFYFNTDLPIASTLLEDNPNYLRIIPELDHLDTLTADDFGSLNTADTAFYWRNNFLGTYQDSFFSTWLLRR